MNYTDYVSLTINGTFLKGKEILIFCKESEQSNIQKLGAFMTEWLTEDAFITVKTSGSTGKPKTIAVEKNQMLQSASMTARFFDFQKGQVALLCLPVDYIAGKMMIVRALFSHLNLLCIEPNKDPLSQLSEEDKIDFAPLVPMQLRNADTKASIRKILLGGSPVDPLLEKKLQSFPAAVFQGYGMTETLSHVALRQINSKVSTETYHALPGITFGVDERDCLVIEVPFLKKPVFTNDVVELRNKTEFAWKGRADHVINSGGIKLFPEEIEKKLSSLISERFFIAGRPDDQLGEKACLIIEDKTRSQEEVQALLKQISSHLEKLEKPRAVFFIKKFVTTASGKINRKETLQLLSPRSSIM